VSCAIGTLVVNPVLVDHPLGYWRLGEPEGATTAADLVGTHSGTYSDLTLDAAGAVPGDSAASFAGAGAGELPRGQRLRSERGVQHRGLGQAQLWPGSTAASSRRPSLER
jgi:hypothetical protein